MRVYEQKVSNIIFGTALSVLVFVLLIAQFRRSCPLGTPYLPGVLDHIVLLVVIVVAAFASFLMLCDYEVLVEEVGSFDCFACCYCGIVALVWATQVWDANHHGQLAALCPVLFAIVRGVEVYTMPRGREAHDRAVYRRHKAEERLEEEEREKRERRQREELAKRPFHLTSERRRVWDYYTKHFKLLNETVSFSQLRESIENRLSIDRSCQSISHAADALVDSLIRTFRINELKHLYSDNKEIIGDAYSQEPFDDDLARISASDSTVFERDALHLAVLIDELTEKLRPAYDKAQEAEREAWKQERADFERQHQQECERRDGERQRAADEASSNKMLSDLEQQVREEAGDESISEDEIQREISFRFENWKKQETCK